jgi:hypothetical protein
MKTISVLLAFLLLPILAVRAQAADPTVTPAASWGWSFHAGAAGANLSGVASDPSGGFYAYGSMSGKGSCGLGPSVSVANVNAAGDMSALVVKFDAVGKAVWARAPLEASGVSLFNAVATDQSGNVYAVGRITGTGVYSFGPGVRVAGSSTSTTGNPIIVKYDNRGKALWARSTSAGSESSEFYSVAVDPQGNVYAAGYIGRRETHTFGPGIAVTGTAFNTNVLLVKYRPDGSAVWARSVLSGVSDTSYYSVAVDGEGNVYAAGMAVGVGHQFGPGVSGSGNSITMNVLLVKYRSDGSALWVRESDCDHHDADQFSRYTSVATDASGAVYAAGYIQGNYVYSFGNGMMASSPVPLRPCAVVVKYRPNGETVWVAAETEGPRGSYFTGLAVEPSGEAFAVGWIIGKGAYSFGSDARATGLADESAIVVAYDADGKALWARAPMTAPANTTFNQATIDSDGTLVAVGWSMAGACSFGEGASFDVPGPSGNWFLAAFRIK